MRLLFLTSLFAAVFSSAQGAGWCDRADRSVLNQAELTICDTPNLRELDSEMARIYFGQESTLSGAELQRLRSEQFDIWLGYRNVCRTNVQCLSNRYLARIAELQGDPFGVGGEGRIDLDIDERRVRRAQSAREFADSFRHAQALKQANTPDPVTGLMPPRLYANYDTTADLDAIIDLTAWAEQRSVDIEGFFDRSLSPASSAYIQSLAPEGNALHRLDYQLRVLSGLEFR